MRQGRGRAARLIAFCVVSAALAGCQTTDTAKVASAPESQQSVSPDIHRILTAGGLNASAPGTLKTEKMPPQVQQAVAALSGQPAPDPAAAALLAAQSGQAPSTTATAPLALAPTTAPNSILPPMIAETPEIKRHGGRQSKVASTKPAKAPAIAAAPAAKAVPFEQAAKSVVAVQGVAAEPQVSAMRSYLPPPMFSPEPVIISGPGARPVRMIQAQPKVEKPEPAAPAPTPVAETKPIPAAEPVVKVRRF